MGDEDANGPDAHHDHVLYRAALFLRVRAWVEMTVEGRGMMAYFFFIMVEKRSLYGHRHGPCMACACWPCIGLSSLSVQCFSFGSLELLGLCSVYFC